MAPVCYKKTRATVPRPFKLLTEVRGMEKEEKFRAAIAESEQTAAKRCIPKANPLPMTTFDRQVPAKPEPRYPTVAQPFHLEGTERHAAALAHVKELREAAEQTDVSFPFHASPVPRSLAVPQVPAKPEPQPPTVLRPFHLEGSKRHAAAVEHLRELREAAEQADRESGQKAAKRRIPKANPLPMTTFDRQVVPKPEPQHPTVARPFHLEGTERHAAALAHVKELREAAEQTDISLPFHASPVPRSLAVPQVPAKPEPQPPTVLRPFHLEGSERHAATAQHIKELREAAEQADITRPFNASPVPHSLAKPQVPSKPAPKPSTIPKEFHLEGVVRHKEELELSARARVIVAKEITKERVFKAQPILDYGDAALPPPMPATVPREMVLETATRVRKAVATEEEAPPKRRAPPSQSPGLRRCAFSIVAERRCGHEYGLLSGFGESQPLLVLSA